MGMFVCLCVCLNSVFEYNESSANTKALEAEAWEWLFSRQKTAMKFHLIFTFS